MSRARDAAGVRTKVACAALLALCAASCGDDGGSSPGVGTDVMDAGSDAGEDAGRDAAADTGVVEPPPPGHDSGADATPPAEDATPPDEDDAGSTGCADLDCERLSDECNVGVCDPVTVACVLQPRPDETPCGSDLLDNCTAPDSCQEGACVANDAPSGTQCGDQDVDCHLDDECDGHGQCVDSGLVPVDTPCGDQTNNDCDDPNTCDDQGVCQPNYAPADSHCGDVGQDCRNDDRCDGQGACVDSGEWQLGQCPQGETTENGQTYCLCGSDDRTACHPGPDVCIAGTCRLGHEQFAPNGVTTDGTPCGDGVPTNAECDNPDLCLNGECQQNGEPEGTPCGDRTTDTICDQLDSCDGFGNCDPHWAPTTTVCDDLPGECWSEPRCDGTGSCAAAAPAPQFTSCGDDAEGVCDHADDCDGAGTCRDNYADETVTCGDSTDDACTDPDTCDGAGSCDPRHEDPGTECGDIGLTCINADTCDGDGACVDNGVTSPCALHGQVLAGGNGVAGVVVEVIGGDSATTDGNGEYDLDVPIQQRFLMHVGDTPGYWGIVRVRLFQPQNLANTFVTSLNDDARVESIAQAVDPVLAVDRDQGLLQVNFIGSAAGGGESVTLSATGVMPIMAVPPDDFVYSSVNNAPEGFMTVYNVDAGSVTITPVDGAANDCALQITPAAGWPVFAHTATVVPVQCD